MHTSSNNNVKISSFIVCKYIMIEYLHEQEKDFVDDYANLKSGFESSAFQFLLRSQEMP